MRGDNFHHPLTKIIADHAGRKRREMIRQYHVTIHPGEHARIGPWGGVKKWQDHTIESQKDYVQGIKHPKRNWARESCRAETNWYRGTGLALVKGGWLKGLKKRGTSGWKKKALTKGPKRFYDGTIVAAPQFQAGFAPYRETIAKTNLGPRFPKRDPRNIKRVYRVCSALGKKKESMGGPRVTSCEECK